jgi:GNAT superfamily N-acetyltransferase
MNRILAVLTRPSPSDSRLNNVESKGRRLPRKWKVRPVDTREFDSWTKLFRGYCDFYQWPTSDEHQLQIWAWIHEKRIVQAIVAVEVDDSGTEVGEPRGLAHIREWIRPLRGVRSGYLDDLFVDQELRGSGAVDALFAEINQMALDRGWDVVRWTTADNNYRARGTYDKIALRTTWITYDMTPQPPGAAERS